MCAAFVGASWAALAFANCRSNSVAAFSIATAASAAAASAAAFSEADTGVRAAVDDRLTLPGIGSAGSCDDPHPMALPRGQCPAKGGDTRCTVDGQALRAAAAESVTDTAKANFANAAPVSYAEVRPNASNK